MKTLSALIFILIFISCEEGGNSTSSSEKLINKDTKSIKLIEGEYKTGCLEHEKGSVKYTLEIEAYSVKIFEEVSTGADCNQDLYVIYAEYDRNESEIEFNLSLFQMYQEGGYICELSDSEFNNEYSIDSIGCEDSYENKSGEVIEIENGYKVNGIDFI